MEKLSSNNEDFDSSLAEIQASTDEYSSQDSKLAQRRLTPFVRAIIAAIITLCVVLVVAGFVFGKVFPHQSDKDLGILTGKVAYWAMTISFFISWFIFSKRSVIPSICLVLALISSVGQCSLSIYRKANFPQLAKTGMVTVQLDESRIFAHRNLTFCANAPLNSLWSVENRYQDNVYVWSFSSKSNPNVIVAFAATLGSYDYKAKFIDFVSGTKQGFEERTKGLGIPYSIEEPRITWSGTERSAQMNGEVNGIHFYTHIMAIEKGSNRPNMMLTVQIYGLDKNLATQLTKSILVGNECEELLLNPTARFG